MAPRRPLRLASHPVLRALLDRCRGAAIVSRDAAIVAYRATRPHLARAAQGARSALRRHPALALALAVRLCWWTGLALLLRAGPAALGYPKGTPPDAGTFALGLGLCAVTATLARGRSLRLLAVAQGTAHAAILTLLGLTAPT